MLGSLGVSACARLFLLAVCLRGAEDECWRLDKEEVVSGGCVTIILDESCASMRGLTLRIDDREPVPLLDGAGVTMQYTTGQPDKSKTLIMISHDLSSPEAFDWVRDDPPTHRMLPVFHEAGTVTLTLSSAEGELGTKQTVVLPAPREARDALDLLYPTVVRGQGIDPRSRPVMQLLLDSTYGVTLRVSREEFVQLCADVEVLRRHPEWAEIFEMLLARLEARIELRELQDTLKEAQGDIDMDAELPKVSLRVTEALDAKTTSPFAKAIQDTIRDMVSRREQLVRSARKRIGG